MKDERDVGFRKLELLMCEDNNLPTVKGWDFANLVKYYNDHSSRAGNAVKLIRTLRSQPTTPNIPRHDAYSHMYNEWISRGQPTDTPLVRLPQRNMASKPWNRKRPLLTNETGLQPEPETNGVPLTPEPEPQNNTMGTLDFKVNTTTRVAGVVAVGGNPCVLLFPLTDATHCVFTGFLLVEPCNHDTTVNEIFADIATTTVSPLPVRHWVRIDLIVHDTNSMGTLKRIPLMYADTKNQKIVDIDYEMLKPNTARKNGTVAYMILDLIRNEQSHGVQSHPKLLHGMGVFAVDTRDTNTTVYTVISKKKKLISTYLLSDPTYKIESDIALNIGQIKSAVSNIRDTMQRNGQWTGNGFEFVDEALENTQGMDWMDSVLDYTQKDA